MSGTTIDSRSPQTVVGLAEDLATTYKRLMYMGLSFSVGYCTGRGVHTAHIWQGDRGQGVVVWQGTSYGSPEEALAYAIEKRELFPNKAAMVSHSSSLMDLLP